MSRPQTDPHAAGRTGPLRTLLSLVVVGLLSAPPAAWGLGAQVTPPQGLSGATIASRGEEVPIYSVQLRDTDNAIISQSYLGRNAPANTGIQLILDDLAATTGFQTSDIAALRLYRSADAVFDGGDVLVATQTTLAPLGGATQLNVTAAPVGSRQLPNPGTIYFIATAVIANGAVGGHAFTVAALVGHIGFDESPLGAGGADNNGGTAIVASDANHVAIARTAQVTPGGTMAIPFGGEPLMLCLLLGTGVVVLWRRAAV